MDHANPDLFDTAAPPSPAQRAAALAPPASHGHYDELRGGLSGQQAAPAWSDFFGHLGHEGFADLNHRAHSLARQIRDNGVSYNVYSDASGPQRPWSLDLFPLIVTPESWSQIEAGVLQRVRVLERVIDRKSVV